MPCRLAEHGPADEAGEEPAGSSDAPPPRFGWHAELADAALEREFQARVGRPRLVRRAAAFVALLAAAALGALVADRAAARACDARPAHQLGLAAAGLALLGAGAGAGTRRALPALAVELCTCAYACAAVLSHAAWRPAAPHDAPQLAAALLALGVQLRPRVLAPALGAAVLGGALGGGAPDYAERGAAAAAPQLGAPLLRAALLLGAAVCLARAERAAFHYRAAARRAAAAAACEQRAAVQGARGRLIRVLMHNLRSPLLAVANAVDALDELPPRAPLADPAVSEAVRALRSASSIAQAIVSDMLDFELIESGRLQLEPAPFSPLSLLGASAGTFEPVARRKGVALLLPDPPPGLEGLQLVGDAQRLLQALNNGVSNALKFTPPGGSVTLSAAVEAGAPASAAEPAAGRARAVRFVVSDTGPGLSGAAEASVRCATPFARVEAGQLGGSGGSGLGLSIARQIVEMHAGSSLSVTNAPRRAGGGARFEMALRLPAAPPAEPPAAAPAPAGAPPRARAPAGSTPPPCARRPSWAHAADAAEVPPAPLDPSAELDVQRLLQTVGERPETAAEPERAPAAAAEAAALAGPLADDPAPDAEPAVAPALPPGVQVLHAEDDRLLRRSIELRLLRKLGVSSHGVDDGALAVAAIRATPRAGWPSLILMDNQMPAMSGTEATRAIRAAGYDRPILGMTGDPSGCAERLEFEGSGLDACLDKDAAGMERAAELLRAALLSPAQAPAPADAAAGGDDSR